jgi:2'-5' RNA ligase
VPESAQRLFFALWPDSALREQIWQVSRRSVAACKGRPVVKEQVHMTLAFLGSVPAGLLPEVRAAAAGIQTPGFDFSLDAMVFWRRPKALVIQPSSFPQELPALVGGLWRALAPLNLTGNPGPGSVYRPHVTVARNAVCPDELALDAPVRWVARDFVLVSSVTDPAGARYEPLARYHLTKPDAQAGNSPGTAAYEE